MPVAARLLFPGTLVRVVVRIATPANRTDVGVIEVQTGQELREHERDERDHQDGGGHPMFTLVPSWAPAQAAAWRASWSVESAGTASSEWTMRSVLTSWTIKPATASPTNASPSASDSHFRVDPLYTTEATADQRASSVIPASRIHWMRSPAGSR